MQLIPEDKTEKLEKRVGKLEDTVKKLTKKRVVYKPFLYRKKDE